MSAPSAVRPGFGPTLPELLARGLGLRPAAARALLLALAAVVVAAGVVGWRVLRDPHASRSGHPAFDLAHPRALRPAAPDPGGLLRFVERRDGEVVASFAVRAVRLPPYRGGAGALLPLWAPRQRGGLEGLRDVRITDEGKARINDVPGYSYGFEARDARGEVLGREVALFPDQPGARDGVLLTLRQRPGGGVHVPTDVGATGVLAEPLSSFTLTSG